METISLNFPTFAFTDYAVLSILLAILLALSSIELSIPNHKDYKEANFKDIRKASSLAFLGILVTLGAGLGAQFVQRGVYDTLLILVPFPFIVGWASFYRRGSKLVDFAALEIEVDETYSRLILNCIRDEMNRDAIPFDALYVACLRRLQKPNTWASALNISLGTQRRLLSALGFTDILNTFTFSEEKCKTLVKKLVDTLEVKQQDDGRYFVVSATKQLT